MSNNANRGMTLIELIVAIAVISVGLAGVLLALNTVRNSAAPLVLKQSLAIADVVMEEILLKPHAVSGTAPTNGATTCGSTAAVRTGFDDVRDYNGYQTTGFCDITGTAVAGLEGYNLKVAVSSGTWQGIANSLQIVVTVNHGSDVQTLTGWRTPYAQ
ncbi:hypothetical protein DLREEDagrD3_25950 [Denitratisoma sp. agr-D3]